MIKRVRQLEAELQPHLLGQWGIDVSAPPQVVEPVSAPQDPFLSRVAGGSGARLQVPPIRFEHASRLPVFPGEREQFHNPHLAVRSWGRMICMPR